MNDNEVSQPNQIPWYLAPVIGLLSCIVFTGCPRTPMSTECSTFFSQPSSVQEKQFRTYDLDKQLDLYRCGMRRRPPESSLSLLISERGVPIVPVLLQKLEAEKDELFQYAIIDIVEVMSVKGQLKGRKDIVDRIRKVVMNMKYSTFREMAEGKLEKIEKNSSE